MSEQDGNLEEFPNEGTEAKELGDRSAAVGELQQLEASPIELWSLEKLGNILSLEYGENLPSDTRKNGEVPVYGSNGQVDTHTEATVDRPGIILGRKGSIGEIKFSDEPFWPIDTTYYITDKESNQNLRLLYYLLQNIQLDRLNAASAIPGLNRNDTYGLNALIPPLEEQRKIASVLYTVDHAIQKSEDVIDTFESIQEGVLRELITRGVTKDGEFRPQSDGNPDLYSKTRWGEILDEWDIEEVSKLVLDDRPVTYGIVKAGEHVQDGIPMIRGENYINGWESLTNFFRVGPEVHKEYSRSTVQPGDILLAVAGANAGVVNIVPEWMPDKVNISRSTARISVDKSNVIPEYMRFVLESPFLQKQIHAWKKGSAQDVLNLSDVNKFEIPLPTIEEQRRIASIVANVREGAIKERQLKDQYLRIKQGLMQDLLSGEVRTHDKDIDIVDEVLAHG